jgi:outer membrane lipoprotein carrier protein
MDPMRFALILAGLLSAGLVASAAQTPPSADELARRLQARYDTVQSFSADFTQTFEGGLLGLPTTERGTLKLRKPDRFRMEYTQPEKKTFVADGSMLFGYFPEDNIGTQDPLPRADEASSALLFVAGRGNLPRDFTAALAPMHPEGEWQLELTPKSPSPDLQHLTLTVRRDSLALTGFGWTDDQGGSTMTRLSNLRENAPIPDREFEFRFPAGVIIR